MTVRLLAATSRPLLLCVAALLSACGRPGGGSAACGIMAMAGPSLLLDQFSVPNQTLGVPPASLPGVLPARLAAGPAMRAAVAPVDSGFLIGIDSGLPASPVPGFGVLIIDRRDGPQGVLLYEGTPIRGAPVIGSVATPTHTLPLIGIELAFGDYQTPGCPIFPDSLRR